MKRAVWLLAMAVSLLSATQFAHGTIIQYTAGLSGPNESPPNASAGSGSAVITIDDVLNTMHVVVSFADLLGPTTAAHIHCCTPSPMTGTAGVATTTPTFPAFPLGVTSGTYDQVFDLTQASSYNPSFVTAHGGTPAGAEIFLLGGMALGESYFNIHSSAFPGGEIRGFLTRNSQSVPEPATLTLLGAGVVGLGWRRRRIRANGADAI